MATTLKSVYTISLGLQINSAFKKCLSCGKVKILKQNDSQSNHALEDELQVEFIYLVFTCMPGESIGDTGLCCHACVTSFEC